MHILETAYEEFVVVPQEIGTEDKVYTLDTYCEMTDISEDDLRHSLSVVYDCIEEEPLFTNDYEFEAPTPELEEMVLSYQIESEQKEADLPFFTPRSYAKWEAFANKIAREYRIYYKELFDIPFGKDELPF